jgi:hypothetical protein
LGVELYPFAPHELTDPLALVGPIAVKIVALSIGIDKIVHRTTGLEQQNKQAYRALFLGDRWVNEETLSGANPGISFHSRSAQESDRDERFSSVTSSMKKANGVMLRLEHV